MKNISNMLKEAQKLQQRMTEMQERLEEIEVSGAAGGGLITVTLNGKGYMRRIKIDPALLVPTEAEMLEDLVLAATNDAKGKLESQMQDEMGKLTGGLPLPPGFKLPF